MNITLCSQSDIERNGIVVCFWNWGTVCTKLPSVIQKKKLVHWYSCEASLTGQGTNMTLLFWTNNVGCVPPMTLCSKVMTNILLSSLMGWHKSKQEKQLSGQMKWVGWYSNYLPYNPHSHYTWAWRRIVSSRKGYTIQAQKYLSLSATIRSINYTVRVLVPENVNNKCT